MNRDETDLDWINARCKDAGASFPGVWLGSATGSFSKLEHWELTRPAVAKALAIGLKDRYPVRDVIPFARCMATDDMVCVVLSDVERKTGSVVVIHDYASSGWEIAGEFEDVESWIKDAASLDDE